MPAHDARGNAVRDAVARADLEAARREAKALAELRVEGAVDTAWQSRLDAMRTAASRIANAQDLSEASRGLAVLARTCGDCHATSAQRNVAVGEPPRTSVNVVPRMRRHEWGVERMWEGLVVPSEEAWRTGARARGRAAPARVDLTG